MCNHRHPGGRACESNSATALGSLGLSAPYMENREEDTTVSDEKALGLFFCPRKSQGNRSRKLRAQSGWCKKSRTLEEQQAGAGEGPKSFPVVLRVSPLLNVQESLQRTLPDSVPAS